MPVQLPQGVAEYAEQYSQEESAILKELNRETYSKVMIPQMLSGHLQGRFLSMLSHMIQPKKILEVGTYTGYSALCMAEGIAEGGELHTIDINEELEDLVARYVEKAGQKDTIHQHIGNALEIIPELDGPFDMVFIDADKVNYHNYYDLVIDKVRKGGYILADNVLWNGRVAQENRDRDTQALHDYNVKLAADNRVETVLATIRDGILIARKTV